MEESRKVTFGEALKEGVFSCTTADDAHIAQDALYCLFGKPMADKIIKSSMKRTEEATKVYRRPKPKSVLVNGDYTTVVWKDGTHTVVKRMEDEDYDLEKALLYAIVKKAFVNSSSDLGDYMNSFDKVKVVKTKPRKD